MYLVAVTILSGFGAFALLWALGANDVANAVGTTVGSKALSPRMAVILAGLFEFLGSSFLGTRVSGTITKSIVDYRKFPSDEQFTLGMFAVLVTATIWIVIGTWFGLPISSTHTVLGGVTGVGILGTSIYEINWTSLNRIFLSWIVSPFLGGLIAFSIYFLIHKFLLLSPNPSHRTIKLIPIILSLVIAIDVVFLFVGGPKSIRMIIPVPYLVLIFFGTAIISYLPSYYILKKLREMRSKGISIDPFAITSKNKMATRRSIVINNEQQQQQQQQQQFPISTELSSTIESSSSSRPLPNNDNDNNNNNDNQLTLYSSGEEMHEIDPLKSNRPLLSNNDPEISTESTNSREIAEFEFIPLMTVTACAIAFAHGGNDVANAIGPFSVVWTYSKEGSLKNFEEVPLYVMVVGGFGLLAGVVMWGYKVIETVGTKITKLTFSKGFAAQLGAGISILTATVLGLPISTTSVIVGSVMGVGVVENIKAVNFKVFGRILIGWIITLPIAATSAMAMFAFLRAVI